MVTPPRSSPTPSPLRLRFGVFEADLATGELSRAGRRVRLQEQPFQILAILGQRPGELITREELVRALWPDGTFVDYDHSLNTAVNKLREALGDSAAAPRFIETLPRRGYRFLAEVTSSGIENEPASAIASAEALPTPHRGLVRTLFILAQLMYLGFYVAALMNIEESHKLMEPWLGFAADPVAGAIVITGLGGIPLRLFLLTAVAFDYQRLHRKYDRLFGVLVVLDAFWALAPVLMAPRIGGGLALALVAALVYLPFGQRTLIRMAYPT